MINFFDKLLLLLLLLWTSPINLYIMSAEWLMMSVNLFPDKTLKFDDSWEYWIMIDENVSSFMQFLEQKHRVFQHIRSLTGLELCQHFKPCSQIIIVPSLHIPLKVRLSITPSFPSYMNLLSPSDVNKPIHSIQSSVCVSVCDGVWHDIQACFYLATSSEGLRSAARPNKFPGVFAFSRD